ncbi:MAG: UbiA family prenyltransferase [Candidatus Thermoplasmatota archaeon]|nr:UbiA family prenyltransferase [Candidatus Thermoplasmatota archaeon]
MRISALFQISRPANCAIAAIGAFAGAYVSTFYPSAFLSQIIFAACAAIFATAGGNALNDYFDAEIDRINKPKRPIPSGELSRDGALSFAIFSFGSAIALAIMANWVCAAFGVLNVAILSIYNKWLKRRGFAGNIAVAYLVGSVFLFGGAAVGNFRLAGLLAAMASLSTLGREILKDIEDMKGDEGKRKTLPMKIGVGNAGALAAFATLAAVAISPVPFFFHNFNALYMLSVIPADALFMYSLWLALGKEQWAKSQNMMKIAMLVAVAAFVIGRATIGLGV